MLKKKKKTKVNLIYRLLNAKHWTKYHKYIVHVIFVIIFIYYFRANNKSIRHCSRCERFNSTWKVQVSWSGVTTIPMRKLRLIQVSYSTHGHRADITDWPTPHLHSQLLPCIFLPHARKPLTHLPGYLSAEIDHGTYLSKHKQKISCLPPKTISQSHLSQWKLSLSFPLSPCLQCGCDASSWSSHVVSPEKTKNQRSLLNITPKPAAIYFQISRYIRTINPFSICATAVTWS